MRGTRLGYEVLLIGAASRFPAHPSTRNLPQSLAPSRAAHQLPDASEQLHDRAAVLWGKTFRFTTISGESGVLRLKQS